jgi:hypothetical protein
VPRVLERYGSRKRDQTNRHLSTRRDTRKGPMKVSMSSIVDAMMRNWLDVVLQGSWRIGRRVITLWQNWPDWIDIPMDARRFPCNTILCSGILASIHHHLSNTGERKYNHCFCAKMGTVTTSKVVFTRHSCDQAQVRPKSQRSFQRFPSEQKTMAQQPSPTLATT